MNEAQFEQAGLDDDEFDEEYEEAFAEEGEPFDDPTRIVHSWRKSMEFTDLIAVCQGFIAGAARLVPKLRGHEFTDTQTKVLENHLEKIRKRGRRGCRSRSCAGRPSARRRRSGRA